MLLFQLVVERMLASEGVKRTDLSRDEFTSRVWEWKEKYDSLKDVLSYFFLCIMYIFVPTPKKKKRKQPRPIPIKKKNLRCATLYFYAICNKI